MSSTLPTLTPREHALVRIAVLETLAALTPKKKETLRGTRQPNTSARRRSLATPDGAADLLAKFVAKAPQYATDKRYGAVLATGRKPRSKLLKLVRLPADQFSAVLDHAVASGRLAIDDNGHITLAAG